MSSFLTELPKGWVQAALEDVCSKITDGTHKTPKYQSKGIRFISIKNIRPFKPIDFSAYEKYISEKDHAELCKRCDPEFDDIVFPRIGTLGFAKRIDFHEQVSLFVGLGLLKPIKEIVLPKYLELYMNTPWIYRLSHDRATGSGRLTLPLAETRKFPILLAPLPEQHRIVAKIERLFSELDKAVAELKKVKEKLELYRQSLLKSAFDGRLTEQWREEHADELESAEELLARAKTEREKRYQRQLEEWKQAIKEWEAQGKPGKKPTKPRKPKELPPLTEKELAELPELPEGWGWTKLNDLSLKITDGEHFRPKIEKSGVYFLSAKDIQDKGVSFSDPLFISEETARKALLRCNPEFGDILIVSRGATVGRMCIVNTNEKFCLLGSVILLKTYSHVISTYLLYSLKSPSINKRLVSISGATAQQAIYLRDIQHVPVPICSRAEQEHILLKLETHLTIAKHIKGTIDNALKQAELLRQAILKKAFSGKLMPQDPNDPPASELLKRIKAEREASTRPSKKSRRRKNENH